MTAPIPAAALDDRLAFVGRKPDRRAGQKAPARPCHHCGASFQPCIRRPEAQFCSKACIWAVTKGPAFNARISRQSAAKRGDAQRGRGDGKTYRKRGGRHEHRVVAEELLGRPLAPGETVHHADEVISNNEPDNLDVLQSQAEHARLHFTGTKQLPEHVRKRMEATRRTKQLRKESR